MTTVGRPKKFDESEVLDKAMLLFWAQGYEGTSLAQLRESMGLSSASLYHTFGSKDGVFEKVIEHYVSRPGSVISLTSDIESDPREVIACLLHCTVDEQSDPTHPPGCLIALSATVGPSNESDRPLQIVKAHRAADQNRIRSTVQRGVDAGVLRSDTPVEALTLLVHTFMLGVATQVHDGMNIAVLHATADTIMNAWDSFAVIH